MNRYNKITGCLLIISAITFWVGWFLMPDAGTADTIHILNMVKAFRTNVLCSVIVQIISSLLYIIVIVRLSQGGMAIGKAALTGVILLGIGAMGMCADAFFHLLAYFMTDDTVTIQADVLRVMEFMQTTGIVFLIPLLLPFFVGSIVLAIGLQRQDIVSKAAIALFIAAFLTGIAGAILANASQIRVPGMAIFILGIFAIGQVIIGAELIKPIKAL